MFTGLGEDMGDGWSRCLQVVGPGMQKKQIKPTVYSICQEPGGSHFFCTGSLSLHFRQLDAVIIPILHMRTVLALGVCPRLHGLKPEELGFEPRAQSQIIPNVFLTQEQEGCGPRGWGAPSPWRHRF